MHLINKRAQLFLIEVVIALSVLIVLISALFSVQTFENSQPNETLFDNGQQAINLIVDNGLIFQYLSEANYSFYSLGFLLAPCKRLTNVVRRLRTNQVSRSNRQLTHLWVKYKASSLDTLAKAEKGPSTGI